MPDEQFRWQRQIKRVEREHRATRLALDRLGMAARTDPAGPWGGVTLADIRDASGRLEATYLIRLFAEFETGLRLYWATKRKAATPGRTRDLLDSVAAMREIRLEILADAQAVREYRNALVHGREGATPVPIAEARRRLCRYFSFLPPGW